jgi:uncharacterized membrane-anchored protein
MTPVVKLYWLRVALGAIAGLISALFSVYVYKATSITDYTMLLNSITVALAVYVVTYYLLRIKLKSQIEQQSKILTTAIGMYFFTWITFFVVFYTAIQVFFPA